MTPSKYQNESDTIKQLFTLGDPHKQERGFNREWSDYLTSGFTEADAPVLIKILTDEELMFSQSQSSEIYAPIHAWRVLGQLKSIEAIAPLISVMVIDIENDWVLDEIPTAMGMIGKQAIEPLTEFMMGDTPEEFSKVAASDCLQKIAKNDPEQRDTVLTSYSQYLKAPDPALQTFNGLLVCNLIDLDATELIDEIRAIFEQGYVDISTSGDLEDVEIALGLRSKRDTPKPHYGDPRLAVLGGLSDTQNSTSAPDMSFSAVNTFVRDTPKIGRNDPCPCGSGKKHKKCCLNS